MNTFAISLYKGASADTILLQDYGRLEPAARQEVSALLSGITISVLHGGREHLNAIISLGALATMMPQLKQALQRLRENKTALVRSGVVDFSVGYYFLFEPLPNTDTVHVSFVPVKEPDVSHVFPDSSQAANLYEYVRRHRAKLSDDAKQGRLFWERLPFSLAGLCRNLEEDILVGDKVLAASQKKGR